MTKLSALILLFLSTLASADNYTYEQRYEYFKAAGYKPAYAKEFAKSNLSLRDHAYYKASGVPTSTIQALSETDMSADDFDRLRSYGVSGTYIIQMAQSGISYDDFIAYKQKGLSVDRIISLGKAKIGKSTYDAYVAAKVPEVLMPDMARSNTSVEDYKACLAGKHSKSACAKLGAYLISPGLKLVLKGCTADKQACVGKLYLVKLGFNETQGYVGKLTAFDEERKLYYLEWRDGSISENRMDSTSLSSLDSVSCTIEFKDGWMYLGLGKDRLTTLHATPSSLLNELSSSQKVGACKGVSLSKKTVSLEIAQGWTRIKLGDQKLAQIYSTFVSLLPELIALKNAGASFDKSLSKQDCALDEKNGWLSFRIGNETLASSYASASAAIPELLALKQAGLCRNLDLSKQTAAIQIDSRGWIHIKLGDQELAQEYSAFTGISRDLDALKKAGVRFDKALSKEKCEFVEKNGWFSFKIGNDPDLASSYSSATGFAEEFRAIKHAGLCKNLDLSEAGISLTITDDGWASVSLDRKAFANTTTSFSSVLKDVATLQSVGARLGNGFSQRPCGSVVKDVGLHAVFDGKVFGSGTYDRNETDNELAVARQIGLCSKKSK